MTTVNDGSTPSPPAEPNPPPRRAGLIPWAEREVGVRLGEGQALLRSTLLDRLELDRWFPSPAVQYAFETLVGEDGPEPAAGPAGGAGEPFFRAESALREEVRRFCEEFFSIPPEQRRRRREDLRGRANDFPTLACRLDRLQPGLSVVLPEPDVEKSVYDLARHVAELFCLTPYERALRRRFPSQSVESTIPRWCHAAAVLKQQFPEISHLEPTLIEELLQAREATHRLSVERLSRGPTRAGTASTHALHEDDPRPRRRPWIVFSTGGSRLSNFGYTCFALLLLGTMYRVVSLLLNPSGPDPRVLRPRPPAAAPGGSQPADPKRPPAFRPLDPESRPSGGLLTVVPACGVAGDHAT